MRNIWTSVCGLNLKRKRVIQQDINLKKTSLFLSLLLKAKVFTFMPLADVLYFFL